MLCGCLAGKGLMRGRRSAGFLTLMSGREEGRSAVILVRSAGTRNSGCIIGM
ncbi:hypothetical protein FKM82_022672 [Ascaphus truei]